MRPCKLVAETGFGEAASSAAAGSLGSGSLFAGVVSGVADGLPGTLLDEHGGKIAQVKDGWRRRGEKMRGMQGDAHLPMSDSDKELPPPGGAMRRVLDRVMFMSLDVKVDMDRTDAEACTEPRRGGRV